MDWIIQHVEVLGIVASMCVILSFLQTGEKRIRMFNIIGAFLFVIYGLIIKAHSVWILNSILIGVQCYRIYKLRKENRYKVPKTVYGYNNTQFQQDFKRR